MPGIAEDLFHEYGVLNGEAAQEIVESAQHIPQQRHAAGAKAKWCPKCTSIRIVTCGSGYKCGECGNVWGTTSA
jgi:hypothetical protein